MNGFGYYIHRLTSIFFSVESYCRRNRPSKWCFNALLVVVGSIMLVSCGSASLKEARGYYAKGQHYMAAEMYRELYRNTSRDQRAIRGVIAYEMAENYRHINQTSRAVGAYGNAIRYGYPDTLMFLHYARMLHREGNYEEAREAYGDFLSLCPEHQQALYGLMGVEQSLIWQKHPSRYVVRREDTFNSNRIEFSPMINRRDGRLYFTSSRESSLGEQRSPVTGMKYNDIYFSTVNVRGEWQLPRHIETPINTDFDEGTPAFSPNGDWMYYTYSYADLNMPTATNIYISRYVNGEWSGGKPLFDVDDLPYSFAHPAPSSCGRYLYFVSDMPGGHGGKDIWRATLQGADMIVGVENMNADINTPGDEMFPYMRDDSTLYFSSDGHPGMGGLDLFMAVRADGGDRWNVKNMQSPINSSADDFGITFFPEEERGFLSSNRNDSRGYDKIYSFEYIEPSINIEGIVVDQKDEFLAGVIVSVVGSDGTLLRLVSDMEGEYKFTAVAGVEYVLLAEKDGFLNSKGDIKAMPADMDTLIYVDFEMTPTGVPVVLEDIFYDFDSADIRQESEKYLQVIVDLLDDHPEVFVHISAHTDRRGTDEYNLKLSSSRASAVINWLTLHGVNPERLSGSGYGKRHPVVVTKYVASSYEFLNEGDVLSEEFVDMLLPEHQDVADQLNRRTEFTISLSNPNKTSR